MLNLEERTDTRHASGSLVTALAKILGSVLITVIIITGVTLFAKGGDPRDSGLATGAVVELTGAATPPGADAAAASTARLMASQNGASDSIQISLVHTESGAASRVLDPSFDSSAVVGDVPVIMAYAEGSFVGYMTKRPVDVEPPLGTFFVVVFDANGERVRSWGILPTAPKGLLSLGQPTKAS